MIIKTVRLHNIRSYIEAEVIFSRGSTLLAGDIGSGKSSILLALEFALFGIRRNHLSGAALLRHGAREGSVEVEMDINGAEATIKRNLKRSKNSVDQAEGYIIRNGIKKDGTAIELKAMILDMLGYPTELLTKTRNLIYRYTVYTPQEEMKQILFEDKDSRLDTLRKVFDIDKYKRVRENSTIVIRGVKETRKEILGKISDLEEKQQLKTEREQQIDAIGKRLSLLTIPLQTIKTKAADTKKQLAQFEERIEAYNQIKKNLEVLTVKIQGKSAEITKTDRDIKQLETEIQTTKKNLSESNLAMIDQDKVITNERLITRHEADIRTLNKEINEFKAKKSNAEELKATILDLSQCPVCRQEVTPIHKAEIQQQQDAALTQLYTHIIGHEDLELHKEIEIDSLRKELNEYRRALAAAEVQRERRKHLAEKEVTLSKSLNLRDSLKSEIDVLETEKKDLASKCEAFKDIEPQHKGVKASYDDLLTKEKQLEIEKQGHEREKETLARLTQELTKEIQSKEQEKQRLEGLTQTQTWIEDFFVRLMEVIEKHVMLNLHQKFNDLFQGWFNSLLEDEAIQVRLDDEFTPIVEQNGYETNTAHLSGGEKTGCALAYRLSLNKVINDFSGDIKTKDLIILDEPTDGFSTDQLDKLRSVLAQLAVDQIILVSHESKIESFVDTVIRIRKEDQVSYVS